jgi:hypothetical protein
VMDLGIQTRRRVAPDGTVRERGGGGVNGRECV